MKRFFRSIFATSFGTLLSRISGFVRDICIAKYLGSGYYSDVFFMAFKIPNFFRKITAEGALSSAFVPIFSSGVHSGDKEHITHFARNIFSILLYFLLVLVVLIEVYMPQFISLLAIGYVGDKLQFTIALAKITFPYLIFISLVALMSGILNSLDRFFAVSIIPLVMNTALVLFFLMARNLSPSGIAVFASGGVLFSGVIQLMFVSYFVIREKIYLYPVKPSLTPETKVFFKKFWHTFLASGIVQINSFTNSIIATLIPGAVSLLYYGDRISQFPLSLIGTAIGISILPALSRALGSGDRDESQALQESSFFLSLFLGLPSAVGLFTLATPIVSVLFERGEFTSGNTIDVANILRIYAIAVPFFIFSKVLNAIFYAKQDTKTPMANSLISLCINVICGCVLVHFYGVHGIAVATLISTMIATILLFWKLFKERIFAFNGDMQLKTLKIIYISIIMGIIIVCVRYLFARFGANDFITLTTAGGLGGISYLILSQALGVINLWDFFTF